jgi:hypothetical protein
MVCENTVLCPRNVFAWFVWTSDQRAIISLNWDREYLLRGPIWILSIIQVSFNVDNVNGTWFAGKDFSRFGNEIESSRIPSSFSSTDYLTALFCVSRQLNCTGMYWIRIWKGSILLLWDLSLSPSACAEISGSSWIWGQNGTSQSRDRITQWRSTMSRKNGILRYTDVRNP